MKKIIFLCTGNTCRSPMAEKIAACFWGREVQVISRGLTLEGEPMSRFARQALEEVGIEPGEHVSRRLKPEEVNGCDLLLTMTEGHKAAILASFPQAKDKVFTLSEYAGMEGEIPDPYMQGPEAYKLCCNKIYRCIKAIDIRK